MNSKLVGIAAVRRALYIHLYVYIYIYPLGNESLRARNEKKKNFFKDSSMITNSSNLTFIFRILENLWRTILITFRNAEFLGEIGWIRGINRLSKG